MYYLKKILSILKNFKKLKGMHIYHVEKNDVDQFLKKISIYDCGHNLIRVGDSFDGGYLLPDILKEVKYSFTAGVGNNISAEEDLKKLENSIRSIYSNKYRMVAFEANPIFKKIKKR